MGKISLVNLWIRTGTRVIHPASIQARFWRHRMNDIWKAQIIFQSDLRSLNGEICRSISTITTLPPASLTLYNSEPSEDTATTSKPISFSSGIIPVKNPTDLSYRHTPCNLPFLNVCHNIGFAFISAWLSKTRSIGFAM